MTQITIIRTSARGAHYITDGIKQAWIQGRWLREDGTLTPRGQEALEAGKTAEEIEAEQKAAAEAREAYKAAQKSWIELRVPASAIAGETDKAYKYWAGGYQRLYGRMVKSYTYLPKSQVKILAKEENIWTISMPKWLFDSNMGRIGEYV